MGFVVRFNLPPTPPIDSFRQIRTGGRKCRFGNTEHGPEIHPKSPVRNSASACREFVKIAGISHLGQSDFGILNLEANEWGDFYHYPRKQDGEIPIRVLIVWGGIVLGSSRRLTERLFAWPFRVSAAVGIRWVDLLNTAHPATVLMKEGLIGFAAKTKTVGKPE